MDLISSFIRQIQRTSISVLVLDILPAWSRKRPKYADVAICLDVISHFPRKMSKYFHFCIFLGPFSRFSLWTSITHVELSVSWTFHSRNLIKSPVDYGFLLAFGFFQCFKLETSTIRTVLSVSWTFFSEASYNVQLTTTPHWFLDVFPASSWKHSKPAQYCLYLGHFT